MVDIVFIRKYIRLAGLVSVICFPRLTGSYRSIIDQLQQVFPVAGDDGKLLAVLTEGIELVSERCLELLTRDVGQLGFGDK